jgi:preprotein translocase subunit SecA
MERRQPRQGRLERFCTAATGPVLRQVRMRQLRLQRLVRTVAAHDSMLQRLETHEMREMAAELRCRLRRQGFALDVVAQTFALIREVAGRTLAMRHFAVQMMGGWVLLHGMVAEMDTGEGKTLTATLPACTAALAGIPVHIVTINDYLAKRDADLMGPIYQAFGLTVAAITSDMEPQARRQAYACDVTYCTNKEVVFDYLKDRIVLGRQASRIHLQLERLYGESARLRQLQLRGL